MFGPYSRPIGRLFLLLPWLLAVAVWAQSPPLTTVQDTVFRADGTPAQGTLLISWPAFTTAGNQAVAAGTTSVTLGAGGALSIALVPNASATPVNTVYTTVYQLDDGTVKTEFWVVPTSSPATLAQVRATLGTSSASSQMVTQQYVNSALAGKANDSAVVHNSGNETVSGVKQFTAPPSLPAPAQPQDAVNKQYVDNAVQNNGSGSYLSTSGGTMTGALTLAADPTSSLQAADKHYADLLAAVKADLIGGLVPPSELGSGISGPSTCLLGNQTWGPCGSGSGGFSYINSTLVANPNFNSTTPAAQNGSLNCSFQNTGSNVSLECPYGANSSSFALGSQAVLNNQGNAYASGLQDFTSASLKLPSGAGYMPAANGAIGYDTTANMPVIDVNGSTQQLALTTSNISGQASTALALAAAPAQCNGSFATGIQANGNANCSVADVLELAETSQPNGIANYGIFWFDATTHTPRIIENNGQVTQLSLMNVFNSDANTLQEYNGTNAQEFDIFGTRSDANDYERLRMGYGQFNGSPWFFVGPDYAGTGQQRGLAFLTSTTPKWAIDANSTFKPWINNSYDIGTSTTQIRNLYLGTGLVFGNGTLTGIHGTTGIAAEAGTLGTTAGAGLCNDGNGNVTDLGCANGGGMPSAPAMGQKAVWNGSGWVARNDWKLDTTVFPGADAGTRGANCLSYLANDSFYGGGVCSEENEPAPDWLMDPFEGSTYYGPKMTPEKTVIILPLGVQTKTEVPVAVASGTTYADTIQGMAELSGPTVGAGGNKNQAGGAELIAGSSFPAAGSSYQKIAGGQTLPGTVSAYVDDGHNSGTYCGLTMSSSTNTGMVAVVGTSDFTSVLMKHEWLIIPATHVSTGQVIGHIESLTNNGGSGPYCAILTRQTASAPNGGLAAGQTYAMVAPVVAHGVEGLPQGNFSGHVNQGSSIHDMTISGNGIPGVIDLINWASPEINFAYSLPLTPTTWRGRITKASRTKQPVSGTG